MYILDCVLQSFIYNSTIYNSKDMEATQIPNKNEMDKKSYSKCTPWNATQPF